MSHLNFGRLALSLKKKKKGSVEIIKSKFQYMCICVQSLRKGQVAHAIWELGLGVARRWPQYLVRGHSALLWIIISHVANNRQVQYVIAMKWDKDKVT